MINGYNLNAILVEALQNTNTHPVIPDFMQPTDVEIEEDKIIMLTISIYEDNPPAPNQPCHHPTTLQGQFAKLPISHFNISVAKYLSLLMADSVWHKQQLT